MPPDAAATFTGLIGEGAVIRRGEGERTVSKQRYKGLGEMNPGAAVGNMNYTSLQ